jgi:hypothetical protein
MRWGFARKLTEASVNVVRAIVFRESIAYSSKCSSSRDLRLAWSFSFADTHIFAPDT